MNCGLASPGPFRLADHPAPARPAVERRIAEVLVAAAGLAARGRLRLGLKELHGYFLDDRALRAEAEHEVQPVLFAPGHRRFAGEPRNRRSRTRVLGHRARIRAAVDVRRPELGRQQMPAEEHIQRLVAVTVVVAVEEPAFLMAVQRIE